MAFEEAQYIFIHSDDNDVFALAVNWVHTLKIKAKVIILRLSNNENIFINIVTGELGLLASNLLPLYVLTGNDHLSFPYNKRKITALKLLKQKIFLNLNNFGNLETSEDDVIKMVRTIFNLLYGSTNLSLPMNKLRYKMYASMINIPSLKCLPPTDNNLMFHILRAHSDCRPIHQRSFAAKQHPNINIGDMVGILRVIITTKSLQLIQDLYPLLIS